MMIEYVGKWVITQDDGEGNLLVGLTSVIFAKERTHFNKWHSATLGYPPSRV